MKIVVENFADLIDRADARRRTFRQINAAKVHAIPLGALVEIASGVRLFVVQHGRDCDQTPLYCLSPETNEDASGSGNFAKLKWTGGFGEDDLTVIAAPTPAKQD